MKNLKMFWFPDITRPDGEDSDSVCRTLERSSSARKYSEVRRFGMYRCINVNSFTIADHEVSGSTSMGSLSRFLFDTEDGWSAANHHNFDRSCRRQNRFSHLEDDVGIISDHQIATSIECLNTDDAHCWRKSRESQKTVPKRIQRQINDMEPRMSRPFIAEARPLTVSKIDCQILVAKDSTVECTKATRLTFNVGGIIFETLEATLAVYPDTLLGDPDRRMKYLNTHTGEFIFHRRFACFDAILFFYQSNGILAKPQTVDQVTFENELMFFGIPLVKSKYSPHVRYQTIQPKREWQHGETMVRKLRRVFNQPFSSPVSSTVAIFNILVTMLLICEFCASTLSKKRRLGPVDPISVLQKGGSLKVLAVVEIFCMLFFNLDFLVRLVLSRQRSRFLVSYLSIIDLVTMLSFHSSILLSNLSIDTGYRSYLHLLRQFRILQMFRLARYNYGFRSLLQTIYRSLVHLGSFILIIPVMSTCFATMMFFFEEDNYIQERSCQDHCEPFGSLSDWFWYSIITITTVGYGDVYPRTLFGKVTGAICAIFGVILFCLLTPVIFKQFVEQYYIPRLTSRKINDEERKLAEKIRDLYYEDGTD